MSAANLIPLPADLPQPWEQPGDEQRFWIADTMHFPQGLLMAEYTLLHMIYGPGVNHAYALYDIPVRGDARRFWAHAYISVAPLPITDDERRIMAERSQEKLTAVMGQLMERWETVWLPEIRQHIDYWERFDLPAATTQELIEHLDETLRRLLRAWEIHFEVVFSAQLAVSHLDELCRDLFGDADPFAAYALVQGFDNLTVRAGAELWKLSRRAMASDEVHAILRDTDTQDVMAALRMSEDGRAFLADLDAYLAEWGQRGATWGISAPGWVEQPEIAIKHLKDYISQPDRDPDAELVAMAAEREERIAAAREQLRPYPEPVREQFEFLLKAAQEGNILTEDHGYWIDFRVCYQVRRVFLEFGRRFAAAGAIERADDILHLTPDEIRQAAALLDAGGVSRVALVAERKAEVERYATAYLPPAVGAAPAGPPPGSLLSKMAGKIFGAPPEASDDPSVVRGAAGSPGVVRGTARVVRRLEDAARLVPGDILVTDTTAPPWTPVFATVAAVVTDTGGVLSHCAVVAREYRIPAVVGTGSATRAIRDGQTIEVDGERGVVRIIA